MGLARDLVELEARIRERTDIDLFAHSEGSPLLGVPECAIMAARIMPLDPPSIMRLCLQAIERFHSHLCRHTFATEWREAGGSLAALQAVLGHGSITVTERYGTIADDLVEREAQRLVQFRAQGGVR